MKTLLRKYSAACLLLYTAVLSVIMFWRTNNLVLGTGTILAAMGWLAWWIERFCASDAVRSAVEADGESTPAAHGSSFLAAHNGQRTGGEPDWWPAPEDPRVPLQAALMAQQVRETLEEAELAVSKSIQAFTELTVDANDVAQCAREVMNWGTEKSPLIHSALTHVSERSEHICSRAETIAATFQYHDLLRHRLASIANYLDNMHSAGPRGHNADSRTGDEIASVPIPSHHAI